MVAPLVVKAGISYTNFIHRMFTNGFFARSLARKVCMAELLSCRFVAWKHRRSTWLPEPAICSAIEAKERLSEIPMGYHWI
jgi:hypothetical protein